MNSNKKQRMVITENDDFNNESHSETSITNYPCLCGIKTYTTNNEKKIYYVFTII